VIALLPAAVAALGLGTAAYWARAVLAGRDDGHGIANAAAALGVAAFAGAATLHAIA
jgi:hypothetical protein